jgi:hypothetical protein
MAEFEGKIYKLKEGSSFMDDLRTMSATLTSELPNSVVRADWKGVDWTDITSFPVDNPIIALELCPIYLAGTELVTSKLDHDPKDETAIINSRVGHKWLAIKRALELLQGALSTCGATLQVRATFADLGVFVTRRTEADSGLIREHKDLYSSLLTEFCDKNDMLLDFRTLSSIDPTNPEQAVTPFVIPEIDEQPRPDLSLEEIIRILSLEGKIPLQSKRQREKAKILRDIVDQHGGKMLTAQAFINTYLNYQTTHEASLHLGMERDPKLLSLQTLTTDSHIDTIPQLNVLVR